MPLGPAVRRTLGSLEPFATRAYSRLFVDLDDLAVTIRSVAPNAKRILDIGCGDGLLATAIRRVLPNTQLLGIDSRMAEPGRMFRGDRSDVEFRPVTTINLLREGVAPFDLVLLCDVLNRVAESERERVLAHAAELTAPGGTVAVKEWEVRAGVGSSAAYYANRYISGDKDVRFMPLAEIKHLIKSAMPGWTRTCEARIPPRRGNLLIAMRNQ